MKNESGVTQVYYGPTGIKFTVRPGQPVPDEHVTDALRAALGPPQTPRRPEPPIRRVIRASNADRLVEVGSPNTPQTRAAIVAASPVFMGRPDAFPGWLRSAASETAPAARWLVSDEYHWAESDRRAQTLAADCRRVLRGEVVQGLSLRRGAPVEDGPCIPLVVVCVHDQPRWSVGAIVSALSDPDLPPCDLVIVDDGSGAHTSAALLDLMFFDGGDLDGGVVRGVPSFDTASPVRMTYLRNDAAGGYTRAANRGMTLLDPERHEFAVLLNSDTYCGNGWLRGLRRALRSAADVGFATPLSNNNMDHSVGLPPGSDPRDVSDGLLLTHSGNYVEAFCPAGFCLAVKTEAWIKHGPFDAELWGEGYGEETHLMVCGLKAGLRAVHAPDTFVFHARSRSFTREVADARSREAFRRIRTVHGAWFDTVHRKAIRDDDFQGIRTRAAALRRLPGRNVVDPRKRVAFLCKTTILCGGVHACFYLAAELRRRGWDAVVVTTDPRDMDMYDGLHAPYVFDGEADLRRSFAAEVFDRGTIVSASWVTAESARQISTVAPDVRSVLFVQDDERRFDHNKGHRQRIELAWRDADVVVNAEWVAEAVAGATGKRPPVIHVGADPLIFHPRPRPFHAALRVAALSRPETTHRGTDVLMDALTIAHRSGVPLDVTLYGSRPPASNFPVTYLGRLRHDDVARALSAADVYIDASSFQGFGLDAVQALMCGTALICTDNGGSSEYAVDGENALICKPGDARAIAAALQALHADRAQLERMQRNARPSVDPRLSWSTLADHWERLLLGTLE